MAKLVVVDLVKPSTLVQADEKKDERGLFSMTLASFWTSSAVFSRGKYLSLFETEGFIKVNKISKDFFLCTLLHFLAIYHIRLLYFFWYERFSEAGVKICNSLVFGVFEDKTKKSSEIYWPLTEHLIYGKVCEEKKINQ